MKKIISYPGVINKNLKEHKTSHLDYIDTLINQEYNKTGNYPVFLELSKESIDKMKAELEDINISNGWFDNWPGNYRGITIKTIKKEKNK